MSEIQALIAAQLSRHVLSHIYIGYSGGIDSHVLLHACASIPELTPRLTAVYVHHGLQAEAEAWAQHCQQVANQLNIGFKLLRVNASAKRGESPEEAARNARYAALKELMDTQCALLVAQHREDQLETVLLQLFRGSGLRGLSGMPESTVFGQGWLLRPLLDVPKSMIETYAKVHQLCWVEDPSNACSDYDRNFLRNDVLPLLKQRWPAVDKTVARSAIHCANAEKLLSHMAEQWYVSVYNGADNTLSLRQLQTFGYLQQHTIIRLWFEKFGLKMPSHSFVERILREVVSARQDSDPVLMGQGVTVRRYRDKLYCLLSVRQESVSDMVWPNGNASVAIGSYSTLSCLPATQGISKKEWDRADVVVRFRVSGEKIALPKRNGRHSLKNLFQEAGIPPWERDIMPLIYLNDVLAAIGDRWVSTAFYGEDQPSIKLVVERCARHLNPLD